MKNRESGFLSIPSYRRSDQRPRVYSTVAVVILLTILATYTHVRDADGEMEGGSSLEASIENAARNRAIEAHGTWRTNEKDQCGLWSLGDQPQRESDGTWVATFLVVDLPDEECELTKILKDPGRAHRLAIKGTITRDGLQFEAQVDSGGDGKTPSLFALAGEASLKGVRLEGVFTGINGRHGNWEGWWHVWNNLE